MNDTDPLGLPEDEQANIVKHHIMMMDHPTLRRFLGERAWLRMVQKQGEFDSIELFQLFADRPHND